MGQTADPPPLYRLSRLLRRLGLLIIVILVIYTLLVAASGANWFRQAQAGADLTYSKGSLSLGSGSGTYTTQVNLTNPTYFAITDLDLVAHLSLPNGELVPIQTPGPTTINGDTTGTMAIIAQLPFSTESEVSTLLTHDEVLPGEIWLNLTYATLFSMSAEVHDNLSWGAPFEDLQVSVGNPVILPNGTAQATVTATFNDHAKIADIGALDFAVESSVGQVCSHGSFDLDVPAGSSYDEGTPVDLAAGCSPTPNGSFIAAFVGDGYDIPLPTETIP